MAVKINANTEIGSTGIKLGEIITSGSNSNGSYIKYSDGTMICRHEFIYTTNEAFAAWGNVFDLAISLNKNFPVAFIEKPNISINVNSGSECIYAYVGLQNCDKTKLIAVDLMRPVATPTSSKFNISYIAIGKWK